MKQTKTILFILIIATFNSCKHDEVVCTLKGRILNECNGAPFANQEIALKQELSSGLTIEGGVLAETTTDADGNFVFTYQSENGESLSINYSGPIIEGIPLKKTQDLGTIIYSPSCKIVYRVKVNNPHTINDTLACFNLDHPDPNGIRIVGPFHDTTFGLFNVPSMKTMQYETKDFSFIKAGWDIISNNHITIDTEITIQVLNCNCTPDTLTLIVN